MQVPLLDLKPQYQQLKTELDAAVVKVCASQNLILGAEVRALEASVARYSGCKYGIGMSSGTDALLVALMVLDIGPGDEVITSPFTFFATGGTIARVGARPVFCDIDSGTFNISVAQLRRCIERDCEMRGEQLINCRSGGRVKALMPVHLYGQLADMQGLMALARQYHLRVIEDAAQAIGAEDSAGQRAGSFGDIGCLSFFPTKNLGAFGDAGMCVTNDAALAERLEIFRVHGGKPKYFHSVIGGNFRLDEIQAAVLNVKLPHLDSWTARRQANAAYYDAAFRGANLANKVSTPAPAAPGARHIYNQYVLRVRGRDTLHQALRGQDIGTEIYYPVPLHQQQCFAYLGGKTGDFPESERASQEVIALPIYPELAPAQLQYVVDSVAALVRGQ